MGTRTGILLVNTGTPAEATPAAVREYLAQFLSNGRIVPLPRALWTPILHAFVLPMRSRASAKKYALVEGLGKSSFIADHVKLAHLLQARLGDADEGVVVRCAMSFGEPSIESELRFLQERGCDEAVVLPVYPQNAFSQAGIVADAVEALAPRFGFAGRFHVVGDYSGNPLYLDAVADTVREAGFDAARDRLLMSFHSIPRADVERGDTYEQTVLATCDALRARLGGTGESVALGFQSRFDRPRKWLDPFSGDVARRWAADGSFDGRLFVVCPNFSVDCLETRYDIELELNRVWHEACMAAGRGLGDNPFVYVECLGATERHAAVLADVLAASGTEPPRFQRDCRSR